MSIHAFQESPALLRAAALCSGGDIAAVCMHLLMAAHSAGMPAKDIAQALPAVLQPYSSAVMRYHALLRELQHKAATAQAAAYAPYSHYSVGAALAASDGTIQSGCNVEVSSYGMTICAERNALVAAVARGKRRFAALVLHTESSPPASPCGACRQMLYEFSPDLIVVMQNTSGQEHWASLRTLLPCAFESHSLSEAWQSKGNSTPPADRTL